MKRYKKLHLISDFPEMSIREFRIGRQQCTSIAVQVYDIVMDLSPSQQWVSLMVLRMQ